MNHKEKINSLKNTIYQLYVNEGRSKSYISKLLEIDRKTLSNVLNYEYKWEQGKQHYLKPSNQKFLNKNKEFIMSRLLLDISVSEIAKELKVTKDFLFKTIIYNDKQLKEEVIRKSERLKNKAIIKKEENKEKSSRNYKYILEEDEIFKTILGFTKYKISNYGKVIKYIKKYDNYYLLKPTPNTRTGRLYISLVNDNGKTKNLQLARIVAHNFCDGFSEVNNTVNHIDGNILNNHSSNLEWVKKDNNSYKFNRKKSKNKYGNFKFILVDNKYEFKTILSLAKFLKVSTTQAYRYIDNECKTNRKIELIY